VDEELWPNRSFSPVSLAAVATSCSSVSGSNRSSLYVAVAFASCLGDCALGDIGVGDCNGAVIDADRGTGTGDGAGACAGAGTGTAIGVGVVIPVSNTFVSKFCSSVLTPSTGLSFSALLSRENGVGGGEANKSVDFLKAEMPDENIIGAATLGEEGSIGLSKGDVEDGVEVADRVGVGAIVIPMAGFFFLRSVRFTSCDITETAELCCRGSTLARTGLSAACATLRSSSSLI